MKRAVHGGPLPTNDPLQSQASLTRAERDVEIRRTNSTERSRIEAAVLESHATVDTSLAEAIKALHLTMREAHARLAQFPSTRDMLNACLQDATELLQSERESAKTRLRLIAREISGTAA